MTIPGVKWCSYVYEYEMWFMFRSSCTEALSGARRWEVKVQPACVFKWFIDACQRETTVWLITTDTLSLCWVNGLEMEVLEPLNKINQPGWSLQRSKWKKDVKSIGIVQHGEAVKIITHQKSCWKMERQLYYSSIVTKSLKSKGFL